VAVRAARPDPAPVVTSLTVVCRLRGDVDPTHARRVLTDVPEDVHSPFAASPRTHFGRLLIVDQLMVHERGPLAAAVLVLSADFDGDDPEGYLLELLGQERSAAVLADVLALCHDAPADGGEPGFAARATRYLLDRRLEIGLQYVNDPRHRSASEIRRAVARHRRLVGFARAHQAAPPDELRRAFLRTFTPPQEVAR
jgi:hypothetical protein